MKKSRWYSLYCRLARTFLFPYFIERPLCSTQAQNEIVFYHSAFKIEEKKGLALRKEGEGAVPWKPLVHELSSIASLIENFEIE